MDRIVVGLSDLLLLFGLYMLSSYAPAIPVRRSPFPFTTYCQGRFVL